MSNKNKNINASKRKLVIGALGVTGAVATEKWSKPMIIAIVMPAHAQTSPVVMLRGSGNGSLVTSTVFTYNI